jgi:hypothetical protein
MKKIYRVIEAEIEKIEKSYDKKKDILGDNICGMLLCNLSSNLIKMKENIKISAIFENADDKSLCMNLIKKNTEKNKENDEKIMKNIMDLCQEFRDDKKSLNNIFVFLHDEEKFSILYTSKKENEILCDDVYFAKIYSIKKIFYQFKGGIYDAKVLYSRISQIIQKHCIYFQNSVNEKIRETCCGYSIEYDKNEKNVMDILNEKILGVMDGEKKIEKKKENIIPLKRELSKNTTKKYNYYLDYLKKNFNIATDMYWDYENIEKILDEKRKINALSNSSIRGYLNAILWYLNNNNEIFSKKEQEIIIKYRKNIEDINNTYDAFIHDGLMSEKQLDVYMDKDMIIKKVNESKNSASEKEYLIMKILIEFPRRLDIRNLKYIESYTEKEKGGNYYLRHNGEYRFIFEDFKNQKYIKNEHKIFDEITPELIELMNNYILHNNMKHGDYMFKDLSGDDNNKMTNFLQKTFLKYVGKKLSVNAIRHSFASSKTNKQDTIKDSIKMSHSVKMHKDYKKDIV